VLSVQRQHSAELQQPWSTGGEHAAPLEELLFGFAFGMYWASVYEHLTWRTSVTGVSRVIVDPTDFAR